MDHKQRNDLNVLDEELKAPSNVVAGSFRPTRNGPCVCGSGLKYKRCCLSKNKITSSVLRLDSFEITWEPLTPEQSKNNFPEMSPEDSKLMERLHYEVSKIKSEKSEYFDPLHVLQKKYPDHPRILNYITVGYQYLGDQKKVEEMIKEMYERFPDYLFAITGQANLYLTEGLPEKAFEVFKGAFTLQQLYPERTVFHISEAKGFGQLMVKYFCYVGDLKSAKIHLDILQKLLDDDDRELQFLQTLHMSFEAIENFRVDVSRYRKRKGIKDE